MRILLVSSEVHPYSKTGGLADMVAGLAKTLARLGHQVGVVTPLYSGIRERFPQLTREEAALEVPLGQAQVKGEVWRLEAEPQLTLYFIGQPDFFERPGLYQNGGADYPDNAERFIFFSKAAAFLAQQPSCRPDVLHLHDWQAGFAALFLRHQSRSSLERPRVCLTIHNLAYQGVFPAAKFALTILPWNYFTPNGVEFYGQMNCLKAGIVFSDALTTVSPRYAREITTEEFGCGLDGLMRARQGVLTGILNGVDYEEWQTTRNPYLRHPFSAANLQDKLANKLALQTEMGLPADAAVPLFASIGRLTEQKGTDILLGALEQSLAEQYQFILLGSGDPRVQTAVQDLARRFPSQVAVQIGFDQALSHRIEAGCDFFLMPSRFEPCGLNQMYSLRYGCIPIVRRTGGLDDAVIDITEDTDRADGIKFGEYSAAALAKAIRKGLALFAEPELLHRFRLNAMAADFSWERTASRYLRVFRDIQSGI